MNPHCPPGPAVQETLLSLIHSLGLTGPTFARPDTSAQREFNR